MRVFAVVLGGSGGDRCLALNVLFEVRLLFGERWRRTVGFIVGYVWCIFNWENEKGGQKRGDVEIQWRVYL